MNRQGPEPEQGSTIPAARIENDFVEPLKPIRNASHRRLPAALPFAIAGLLVFSSVAFGATVARNIIAGAAAPSADVAAAGHGGHSDRSASPSSGVETDNPNSHHEDPSKDPTASPSSSPTNTTTPTARPSKAPEKAPTATHNYGDLGSLKVKNNGNGTYTFSWAAYKGGKSYDYYKLSGVKYPGKPGYVENDGQYWDGGCVDPGTTSVTVSVGAGTWNFNVEAVKLGDSAVAVARTKTFKLAVAEHTAPPIVSLSLSASVHDDGSVALTWSKYSGESFQYYGIVRVTGGGTPTLKAGQTPKVYFDNRSTTSWTDNGSSDLGSLTPGTTYSYRVYAYTEATLGLAGGVMPACEVGTILGVSNVKTVTIPTPATGD